MRINKKYFTAVAVMLLTLSLLAIFSGCKEKEKEPYTPPTITTQYTVSYYDEDGTTPLGTKTFTHGDYVTFPDVDKLGHTPKWTLYDENGEEVFIDTAIQNMKAVVSYEKKDAMVSLYSNIDDEQLLNECYYYGDTFYVDNINIDLIKPGYIFKGISEDGGKTFAKEFYLTGSISLEAIYEAIPYTITFFYDDVPGHRYQTMYSASTTTYGAITLPGALDVEGYTFDGWYVQDGYTNKKVGVKGDSYLVSESTDFYAVYTKTPTESDKGATEK